MAETEARAFGIDTSRWDGLLNWQKILDHTPEVCFIGYRATISWGYRDPFFLQNWRDGGQMGIPRLAYHVIYPGEDVTRQVDNLFGVIGAELKENDRLVLDAELDHGINKTAITANILKHGEIIKQRTGHYPVLYSRANWLNTFTYTQQLIHFQLWLAQYELKPLIAAYAPEMTKAPTLPIGFTSYLIHQTGDKLPPFCAGTTKQYQDYDRWNGTKADVRAFFGIAAVPGVPSVDPLDEIEQSAKDILTHVAEMRK